MKEERPTLREWRAKNPMPKNPTPAGLVDLDDMAAAVRDVDQSRDAVVLRIDCDQLNSIINECRRMRPVYVAAMALVDDGRGGPHLKDVVDAARKEMT